MTTMKIQSKDMLAYGATVIATVLLMREAVSSKVLAQITATNAAYAIILSTVNPNT